MYISNFSIPTYLKNHFVSQVNQVIGSSSDSELKFSNVSTMEKAERVYRVLELVFQTNFCKAHTTIVNSKELSRHRFGKQFELSSEFRFMQANLLYGIKAFTDLGDSISEIHMDSGPLQKSHHPGQIVRADWPDYIKIRVSGSKFNFTESNHVHQNVDPVDARLIQVADLIAGAVRQAHSIPSMKKEKRLAAAPLTKRLGGRSIGTETIMLSSGQGNSRVSVGEVCIGLNTASPIQPNGSYYDPPIAL
jgi:hypothetical protein